MIYWSHLCLSSEVISSLQCLWSTYFCVKPIPWRYYAEWIWKTLKVYKQGLRKRLGLEQSQATDGGIHHHQGHRCLAEVEGKNQEFWTCYFVMVVNISLEEAVRFLFWQEQTGLKEKRKKKHRCVQNTYSLMNHYYSIRIKILPLTAHSCWEATHSCD